jgi:hypothetical protein
MLNVHNTFHHAKCKNVCVCRHPQEMSHLRAANDALRKVLEEHGVFLSEDSSQNYFEVLSVSTPHTHSDASSSHEFARSTLPQYMNDTEQRSR